MEIAAKKLIIAIDDMDIPSALGLVRTTKRYAETFKVGLAMFCAHGPKIVSEIKALGVEVFLDLKLHDIPMQVRVALENIVELGPRFITLHALGGPKMLKEASMALHKTPITPLAVSLLTSHDEQEVDDLGLRPIGEQVLRLVRLAKEARINSFVASAHEVAMIKKELGAEALVICPGIRQNTPTCDQSRVMTAYKAILAGADAIVVGRPITHAVDREKAASMIHEEINKALENKQ